MHASVLALAAFDNQDIRRAMSDEGAEKTGQTRQQPAPDQRTHQRQAGRKRRRDEEITEPLTGKQREVYLQARRNSVLSECQRMKRRCGLDYCVILSNDAGYVDVLCSDNALY